MGYTEVEVYAIINLIRHDLISHSAFSPNEAAGNNTVYIEVMQVLFVKQKVVK